MRAPRTWYMLFAVTIVAFVTIAVTVSGGRVSAANANPFAGNWTYRSFRNDPTPVGDVSTDPSKLVRLLFAEAQWVVEDSPGNTFKGQLKFGPNDIMDLTGAITSDKAAGLPHAHIQGQGRPGTSTAALFYDMTAGWHTTGRTVSTSNLPSSAR